MERAQNVIYTVIEWCINNPEYLFWVLLPVFMIFLWAAWKIFKLHRARMEDSRIIRELSEFQLIAVANEMSSAERIEGYQQILSKKRNNMTLVLYKYVMSNIDFEDIAAAYTYPEYIKVGRISPHRARLYHRIFIFNPFILLFIVWGALISLAYATDMFYEGFAQSFVSSEGLESQIVPLITVGFYVATIILLAVYRHSNKKFKKRIITDLQATAPEFFAPIDMDAFAAMIIDILNPSAIARGRVKALIFHEGGHFRQVLHDKYAGMIIDTQNMEKEYGTPDEVEEVQQAPAITPPAEPTPSIEQITEPVVTQTIAEPVTPPSTEPAPVIQQTPVAQQPVQVQEPIVENPAQKEPPVEEVKDIEQVLEKFEHMPHTPVVLSQDTPQPVVNNEDKQEEVDQEFVDEIIDQIKREFATLNGNGKKSRKERKEEARLEAEREAARQAEKQEAVRLEEARQAAAIQAMQTQQPEQNVAPTPQPPIEEPKPIAETPVISQAIPVAPPVKKPKPIGEKICARKTECPSKK